MDMKKSSFHVTNEEKSREIQEALFTLGYTWADGQTSFWNPEEADLNLTQVEGEYYINVHECNFTYGDTPKYPVVNVFTLLEKVSNGPTNSIVEDISAPALLKAALKHMQDRASTYDSEGGERSMGKAVEAFNIVTDNKLTESEGWLLMQLLKDVRQWSREKYHQDSAEDCIAYAALKGEALANNK